MHVAQIARAGGAFELVEREIPGPAAGWVRIKVQACGICHSDSLTKEGHWPGIQYLRVPGHEVVGVIDALGAGVTRFQPGQRVGVAGTAGIAASVTRAATAISLAARWRCRLRGSVLMAVMAST